MIASAKWLGSPARTPRRRHSADTRFQAHTTTGVAAADMKTWFIAGASRGFGRIWAGAALTPGDKVAAAARKSADVAGLIYNLERERSDLHVFEQGRPAPMEM
jgi:hypothetical protein